MFNSSCSENYVTEGFCVVCDIPLVCMWLNCTRPCCDVELALYHTLHRVWPQDAKNVPRCLTLSFISKKWRTWLFNTYVNIYMNFCSSRYLYFTHLYIKFVTLLFVWINCFTKTFKHHNKWYQYSGNSSTTRHIGQPLFASACLHYYSLI